ncbi:MAG: ribonuclease HII [Candidatus Aenigmarchaeota archaeon]|nr:ribonuclease HII [Candidatus Aenigmarchaeota archaeon]
MALTLGIDEAGRGSVIGSLVVCGAVFDENDLPKLKQLGVKDSKLLSPHQRERLEGEIRKIAKDIVVEKIEPWDIDKKRGDGINLNRLEVIRFIRVIDRSFEKVKIGRVIIDSPDPNLPKFRLMLANLIRRGGLEVIAEHYADSKYIECSAASVVAKVTRDNEIESLKEKYGDFGAGYPSDPKCIEWLENRLAVGELPEIVRHSWDTISNLKNKKLQKDLKKFLANR